VLKILAFDAKNNHSKAASDSIYMILKKIETIPSKVYPKYEPPKITVIPSS
jgi:hypothetical protein